ncbi:MAG: ATP-binding protein [Polyangiaceae bacterium]|nr:ATP-binding protein [Polyangiaceae bacterium]
MADPANREERHAAWVASLVDGGCPVCGTVPEPKHIGCRACWERADNERMRLAEVERFTKRFDEYTDALPSFRFATPENAEWVRQVHPKIREVVAAWNCRSSLMLFGETGCGKTTSIVARLRAEAERLKQQARDGGERVYWDFMFTTEADILEAHRTHKLGTELPKRLRSLRSSNLAVIDEMGFQPEYGIPIVMRYVDERYREGRPTVITSGLTYDAFVRRYSPALVRRVLQAGDGGDYFDLSREGRG